MVEEGIGEERRGGGGGDRGVDAHAAEAGGGVSVSDFVHDRPSPPAAAPDATELAEGGPAQPGGYEGVVQMDRSVIHAADACGVFVMRRAAVSAHLCAVDTAKGVL